MDAVIHNAGILGKLGAREYTVLEERKFRPTILGREVNRRLVPHFDDIIETEYTSRLEEQLAAYVGVKHCVTCASGTDALLMPLMALGVGPGDEVITTPFTFVATAEVVRLAGATPVYGDIDADRESAYSVGDEAPGGDNPTPDQDIVDDIGRAVGVSTFVFRSPAIAPTACSSDSAALRGRRPVLSE